MASLRSALNGRKVNTGAANRDESDRFQNKDLMLCPVWHNHDNMGRVIKDHSHTTKTRGCNLSSDRVTVENELRLNYVNEFSLSDYGVTGEIFNRKNMEPLTTYDTAIYNKNMRDETLRVYDEKDQLLRKMSGMD
tara:strand:+ start:106 stop:510 length:405 start_codon:yes stop_codon:yes gene_type:complete